MKYNIRVMIVVLLFYLSFFVYHPSFVTADTSACVPNASSDSTIRLPNTGDGTNATPYVITTIGELQGMKLNVNASYILGNDIEACVTKSWNGGKGFEPVGNPFKGRLNGKGFKIKNLYINRPGEAKVGLFRYVTSTSYPWDPFGNFTVENAFIRGGDMVGIVVGEGNGMINVKVTGDVEGRRFVGLVAGLIRNATNFEAQGIVKGNFAVGGIAGRCMSGSVQQSRSYATIIEKDDLPDETVRGAGGICGNTLGMTISENFFDGSIVTTNTAGGIAGTTGDSNFINNYAKGYLYGKGNKAGIVYDMIEFGAFAKPSTFTNNYVSLQIENEVPTSPALGFLTGSIAEVTNFNVTSSYWDGSSFPTASTPFKKSLAELRQQTTYAGWDFTNIWSINPAGNNGLPYLKNNLPSSIIYPNAPLSFHAEQKSDHVLLTWGTAYRGDSFELRRNGVKLFEGTGYSFQDKTAQVNTTYTYEIIAKNIFGESPPLQTTITTKDMGEFTFYPATLQPFSPFLLQSIQSYHGTSFLQPFRIVNTKEKNVSVRMYVQGNTLHSTKDTGFSLPSQSLYLKKPSCVLNTTFNPSCLSLPSPEGWFVDDNQKHEIVHIPPLQNEGTIQITFPSEAVQFVQYPNVRYFSDSLNREENFETTLTWTVEVGP